MAIDFGMFLRLFVFLAVTTCCCPPLSTRVVEENEVMSNMAEDLQLEVQSDMSAADSGADPGCFLGGGAPLRNDITDGEVKKNQIRIHEEHTFISGGGAHPLHPPPRSAPD